MYGFIAVDFSKRWTRTHFKHDIRPTRAFGTIWIVLPVTKASLSDKFGEEKTLLLFLCQTRRRKRIFLLRICEV